MKEVLVFITDNFAEWEAAHVAVELNKPEHGFTVRTAAADKEPKRSMGGLTVLPDYDIREALEYLDRAAMLIIAGGTDWLTAKHHGAAELVSGFAKRQLPVAAICDGVTFIAGFGYLDEVRHTGNTVEYLKQHAPAYRGEHCYVEAQAVTGGNFITANGTGNLEFAREILNCLGVLEGEALESWYSLWKNGYYPAESCPDRLR